jgi:hypothetical protein
MNQVEKGKIITGDLWHLDLQNPLACKIHSSLFYMLSLKSNPNEKKTQKQPIKHIYRDKRIKKNK